MKVKVALDTTPTTMHAGLLLAEIRGYFKDQHLQVELISPARDHYAATPVEKLAGRQVHLAVSSSESVISYNTLGDNSVSLIAIAAMLQQDTTAIATLKNSGIERPAQLDGKVIGSYGARFEEAIVRQLILADGGKGSFTTLKPEKPAMWQNLLDGSLDAAWICMPWEGVKAEYEEGLGLHVFRLRDYDIPYGYSPLLITHQDYIREEKQTLKSFLNAVEKGWRDVYKNPVKAASQLQKYTQPHDFHHKAVVVRSLELLAPAIFNERQEWGFMEGYHWLDFVDWMISRQVLTDTRGIPMNHGQIDTTMLYTNEFFKM